MMFIYTHKITLQILETYSLIQAVRFGHPDRPIIYGLVDKEHISDPSRYGEYPDIAT